MFDADHAIPDIQVIVPRKRIQFRKLVDGEEVPIGRLPVFLLATRAAEGRGVLDTMAVSNLPSEMRRVPKYRNFRSLSLGVLGIVNFKTSRYTYFEQ